MNFTPREKRLLHCLLERTHSRLELGQKVKALNIPHHVMMLRGKDIPIKMKTKAIRDFDNNVTHPGFYYLDEGDRDNVRVLLGLTAINPDNGFQNNLAKVSDKTDFNTVCAGGVNG